MAKKYTLLMNWKNTRGWSETFYTTESSELNAPQILTYVNRMARLRAACLTNGATILSCRVSDPAAPATVRGIELNLPGVAGNGILSTDKTDVVALAALVNFYSENGVRRAYLMRGLTDADVVDGELTFAYTGRSPYNAWWNFINGTTAVRDVVNGTFVDIVTLSGAGVLTTVAPLEGALNTRVKIRTRTQGAGPRVDAFGFIQSRPGANVIQLRRWSRGDCALGQACPVTIQYRPFSSYSLTQPALVRTRQTGHPFGLLRGRRSAN